MIEAMNLNDLLASAPDSSELATTDRLFAIGSDGTVKRIKRSVLGGDSYFSQLSVSDSTQKWYTVTTVSSGSCWGGVLMLTQGNWSGGPSLRIFSLAGRYNYQGVQRPKISSLLGTDTQVKLRVIYDGANIRIDAYLGCKMLYAYAYGPLPLSTPKIADEIPSGATVWEYDFTNNIYGT